MEKIIEIPEGYEARIEGNKVVFEPKESEDERIRKFLIQHISEWIGCIEHDLKISSKDIESEKELAMFKAGLAYLEKQKEQKPAEYEKSLLSKFEQAVYDCAWGKVTCKPEGETQEEYAKRWAEHLLLMVRNWADDYIDSQIESAKRKAYNKGKTDAEKPAEWSEEDIKKIRSEEYTKGFNDAAFGGKLKEWSVEDEDRIRQIERIAQAAGCSQKLQEEIHDWLKSLHPRPHWKPSEEQMEWLEQAVRLSADKPAIHGVILSLYNDLKKLL